MLKKKIMKGLAAVVAFVVVFAICLTGLNGYNNESYLSNRKAAYDAAKVYTDSIEKELEPTVVYAADLAGMVRMNPAMTSWFDKKAKELMDKDRNIVGIELTKFDKVNKSQTYPKKFSIKGEANLLAAYNHINEDMMDSDSDAKVVAPVVMKDESLCMLTVAPIYKYNNRTQSFDKWGTASVVLRLPDTLKESDIPSLMERDYAYALYGNNPLMENDGLIMASKAEISGNAESSSAVVAQGRWLLKTEPVGGFKHGISDGVAIAVSVVLGAVAAVSVIGVMK